MSQKLNVMCHSTTVDEAMFITTNLEVDKLGRCNKEQHVARKKTLTSLQISKEAEL